MADIQGQVTGVFDSIFGGGLTIVLWVVVGFFVVVLGGGIVYWYFNYKRKFNITCKIISMRAGEDRVYFDKGAILHDKKKNMDYLKLATSKTELELPKFKVMANTNQGDYLELIRESERSWRFLTPPKISRKYLLRYNGKLYPIAQMKQYQIENDLSWTLERMKKNKSIINPESILMKLLEYAPQIISMGFSFIIVWIVFRYAPELLAEMSRTAAQCKLPPTEVIGSLIPLGLGLRK